jgi:hypothetical protein
MRCAEHAL